MSVVVLSTTAFWPTGDAGMTILTSAKASWAQLLRDEPLDPAFVGASGTWELDWRGDQPRARVLNTKAKKPCQPLCQGLAVKTDSSFSRSCRQAQGQQEQRAQHTDRGEAAVRSCTEKSAHHAQQRKSPDLQLWGRQWQAMG